MLNCLNLDKILSEFRQELKNLYGDRLIKLVLYGSQVRGEAKEDSDIDILVVLKDSINPYQEINKTSHFIANLCLKYDVVISRHFISAQKFNSDDTPFLCNIRKDGLSI
jgi:predicted nucleotidyltransferase